MRAAPSGGRLLRRLFPTRHAPLKAVLATAEKVLDRDTNILILGESGVGKDHLSEAIHICGRRQREPFVKIDCGSIPSELFESELFGYEKGAFTDAAARKIGRIERADRGSLYFDEVASLSPPLQAKLLRVIEEKAFTRLGGTRTVRADVRIVASSSRRLEQLIEAGAFRRDLYYRLNVVSLTLPPLRQRPEDVALLAGRFLEQSAVRCDKRVATIDADAMQVLMTHQWPGNVRELRNVIERAVLVESRPVLTAESLPLDGFLSPHDFISTGSDRSWSLTELETRYIREVLRRTGNNFSRTAQILGINRKTLLEKRRRYGID